MPRSALSQRALAGFIYGISVDITTERRLVVEKPVGGALGYRLKKTVVMVGMMGAGKTAIGMALARKLSVPFLDSDAEIVMASNMTIAEIFERDGEPFFRQREREIIARLLTEETGVLSTGGGAYLSEENRRVISERGVALWLRADLPLLWNRVRHKDSRPLLRTPDPRATLARLYRERVPHYAKADLILDTEPDYSISQTTDLAVDTLLTRPDVLEVLP
ncbi:MAG: shikimate kinase [Pseudomonadota bacterium]